MPAGRAGPGLGNYRERESKVEISLFRNRNSDSQDSQSSCHSMMASRTSQSVWRPGLGWCAAPGREEKEEEEEQEEEEQVDDGECL